MNKLKIHFIKGAVFYILSFLFSIQSYNFLEQYLLNHVKTIKGIEEKKIKTPNKGIFDTDPKREMSKALTDLECYRGENIFDKNKIDKCQSESDETRMKVEIEGDAVKSNVSLKTELIVVIEWLLIISLSVQIFLASYTIFLEKNQFFDIYVFHISDWAINVPPILGVLANLLSFAQMLKIEGRSAEALFSSNYFFEAIVTTLIGGLFYIINLALKIIIQSRIDKLN